MKDVFFSHMKRIYIFIITLWAVIHSAEAQEALPDTLNVKSFDGYLLDMNLLRPSMPAPFLNPTIILPDATRDYNALFKLDSNSTYGRINNINPFGLSTSQYYSSNPFGLTGFGSKDNLQMGSFRLKNGWRINTYGQYNKEGWRIMNPSALPWERNDFKGAFELKSANGNFGLRIEVKQNR